MKKAAKKTIIALQLKPSENHKQVIHILQSIENDIFDMKDYIELNFYRTKEVQEFVRQHRNSLLSLIKDFKQIFFVATWYSSQGLHAEQFHLLLFLKTQYQHPEATYDLGVLYRDLRCEFMKQTEEDVYESSQQAQIHFTVAATQEIDMKTQHKAKFEIAKIAKEGRGRDKEDAYKLFDMLSTSKHLDENTKNNSMFYKAQLIQSGHGPNGFGCNPLECGITNANLAKQYWIAKQKNDTDAQSLYMQLEKKQHGSGILLLGIMAYNYEGKVIVDKSDGKVTKINKPTTDKWSYSLFKKAEIFASGIDQKAAIHWQGRMIYEGKGTQRNGKLAIATLQKASLPSSFYLIGQIYQYGCGIPREKGRVIANKLLAIKNYKKAYEISPPPTVISAVRFGFEKKQTHRKKGIATLSDVHKKDPFETITTEKIPLSFNVTKKSTRKEYFLKITAKEKIVSNKQVMAHFCLGKILYAEGKIIDAFKHINMAVKFNLVDAIYWKAMMIDQGQTPDGRKDHKEAYRLMRLIADRSPAHPRAQYFCGCCLERDDEKYCKKDLDHALNYFKAAAGAKSFVYIETNAYSGAFSVKNARTVKTLFNFGESHTNHISNVSEGGNKLGSDTLKNDEKNQKGNFDSNYN